MPKNACRGCREDQPLFPLTMAFQPVVDLEARRIDAYEALVRGLSGEGAGEVMSTLTDTTRYQFDQACRVKAISLAKTLGIDRRLNINFMPNAVYEPKACIRVTLETAEKYEFPLDQITFEIVEDERISDSGHLHGIIKEYRRHGFKIALDDFSSGYSGLSLLVDLKPDIIKLDRFLVKDCDEDSARLTTIASVLKLARELDIKVVMEGVERGGEVAALRGVGGRFMQGYFFGRPLFEAIARDEAIVWA